MVDKEKISRLHILILFYPLLLFLVLIAFAAILFATIVSSFKYCEKGQGFNMDSPNDCFLDLGTSGSLNKNWSKICLLIKII